VTAVLFAGVKQQLLMVRGWVRPGKEYANARDSACTELWVDKIDERRQRYDGWFGQHLGFNSTR
jgi:hypothetical protein